MHGKFLTEDRPNFIGIINKNCAGLLHFPDEQTKNFRYDEEEYKVFWYNQKTGGVWEKGKNFYKLRFIENKALSRGNDESNKNNKTSNQKYR